MVDYTRTSEMLLDIRNVSLSFGNKLVLRDVDATIYDVERPDLTQGQVICFLGPSGIGKTQLSRIIAGLQAPTSGAVVLQDGKPTAKGCVCMVPQNYPLFDFATVSDNLSIAGRQSGLPTAEWQTAGANYIDKFGLTQYLKMYPKELSGGTRQRVAIARQMMCASHYLVMDEPFSGLDPIMKAEAMHAITTLANMDTYNTIIIVTHDVTEGLAVADTVWLMGYEQVDGKFLPGAKIVDQYDLAAMDLCWRPEIHSEPRFLEFVTEVKARFKTLR